MIKRVLKIFIVLTLFIPCAILAKVNVNYNDSLDYVNKYIVNFPKYTRYIVYDNNKYEYSLSGFGVNPFFENSGYLNLYEFQIAGGLSSYLWSGDQYHTMTIDGSGKIYNIVSSSVGSGYSSFNKNTTLMSELSGMKLTQYIKPKTEFTGSGTRVDPWVIKEISDLLGPIVSIDNQDGVYKKSFTNALITVSDNNGGSGVGIMNGEEVFYYWTTVSSCPTSISNYGHVPLVLNDDNMFGSVSVSSTVYSNIPSQHTGVAKLCVYNNIKDEYNNSRNEIVSKEFYFDNTGPTVALVSRSGYTKNTPVTANISDSYSNLASSQSIKYLWNGTNATCPTTASSYVSSVSFVGGTKTSSASIPAPSNYTGINYLCVYNNATDSLGNRSNQFTSKAYYFDNSGPTVTIVTTGTTYQKSYNVSVSVTDNNLSTLGTGQSLRYYWNGNSTSCPTSLASYSSIALTYAAGNKTATAIVPSPSSYVNTYTGYSYLCVYNNIMDSLNNVLNNRLYKVYYFDNTKPVIATTKSSSGSIGTLTITSTVESHSLIRGYQYAESTTSSSCSGATFSALTTATSKAWTLADGTHYLCAKATDNAGNVSVVSSQSVAITSKITYSALVASHSCTNTVAGSAPYLMTYNGPCTIIRDITGTENWKIRLTGSGTLTFSRTTAVDAFLVGGGAGGGNRYSYKGGGGGGGGRTAFKSNYSMGANVGMYIKVGGAGGTAGGGGTSSGFGLTAAGGSAGGTAGGSCANGGAGGSGGGGAGCNQSRSNGGTGGNGGSYGNRGNNNNRNGTQTQGGSGQGGTTCEFNEGSTGGCTRGASYAYSGGGGGGAGYGNGGYGIAGGNGACGAGYGCGGKGANGNVNNSGASGKAGVVLVRDHR